MPKPFVVIESPYAGDVERNVRYARACLKDSLQRGEAPFAGHLLYTQVLDDTVPEQRELGMAAHLDVARSADTRVAIYCDLGVSPGMKTALDVVLACPWKNEYSLEYRRLWPSLTFQSGSLPSVLSQFAQRFLSDAELDRLLTEAGV